MWWAEGVACRGGERLYIIFHNLINLFLKIDFCADLIGELKPFSTLNNLFDFIEKFYRFY